MNALVGERRAIFLYIIFGLVLETTATVAPKLPAILLTTALLGLTISTFYMAAVAAGARFLPRAARVGAFALLGFAGHCGSALFPLVVGLVSAKRGIWVMEPMVIALLGGQGACWYLVPKTQRL